MPTLVRTLLALFAAVAVSVAAWAGLCAAGIVKARIAPRAAETAPPPAAEAPVRVLPKVATTTEASARRAPRARTDLRLSLRGSAPTQPVVLTVFDGWSGAPLATQPVDAAALAAGHLVVPGIPSGRHRVTLAPSTATARNSYVTAVTATVGGEQAEGAISATIDTTLGELRVVVLDSRGAPAPNVVVVAERVDDPAWRCPVATAGRTAHPMTDKSGAVSLGPLGAGRYRVRAMLVEGPVEEVEFPALTAATIQLRPAR